MRKIALFLLMAMALTMVSCSTSVPAKMTRLANKVEAKVSEKAEAITAISKFSAKAIKCGAEEVLENTDFEELAESITGSANELVKGAKSFLEGLGL